ncbi:Uncharacterised protein [BD1-7 clade bacterium]|uniref:DUF481 domain-containing protein n=1 Tax=BD1-7 clade bacterium TaxID=2029982 RepID=A0A5S9NSD9_9GAMM|nr:Uncharacterised protein [BD1-7 clade bacterium]CAA0093460.1 Uncharacterised protein [BD1-7 clade bacterium]
MLGTITSTRPGVLIYSKLPLRAALYFLLLMAALPCRSDNWYPVLPPLDTKWDWLQLTSQEWLKGTVEVMYSRTLEFDSDKLGDRNIKWKDIQYLRTGRQMQIRLKSNRILLGRILVQNGVLTVTGYDEVIDYDEVLTVTAGEPKESNYWKGNANLGANFRSGNTNQTEVNAQASFQRRTIENRLGITYTGNYSVTDDVLSANNHLANVSWDKFIDTKFFWQVLNGEYYKDTFQNINNRITIGSGIGLDVIDTSKMEWQISGNVGYQYTENEDVESGSPSSQTPALSFVSNLEMELTSDIDYTLDYRVQIVNRVAGLYNFRLTTGFEFEVTSLMDLLISFEWDRIENPTPTSDGQVPLKDDYRSTVGLSFDF